MACPGGIALGAEFHPAFARYPLKKKRRGEDKKKKSPEKERKGEREGKKESKPVINEKYSSSLPSLRWMSKYPAMGPYVGRPNNFRFVSGILFPLKSNIGPIPIFSMVFLGEFQLKKGIETILIYSCIKYNIFYARGASPCNPSQGCWGNLSGPFTKIIGPIHFFLAVCGEFIREFITKKWILYNKCHFWPTKYKIFLRGVPIHLS